MTTDQLAELTAYMNDLNKWNPGLVKLRQRMPLELQYQHMRLDKFYDTADK